MIRARINNELTERNWSVRRLADETGIRYASLTEYLSGKRELSSKNLEIVFKELEIMQEKKYSPKEQISYDLGCEVKKAGLKMKENKMPVADTYGFVDLFIVRDSKKGINLEYSLNKIKTMLEYFSDTFFEKLNTWRVENGKFSIDNVKFTKGMMDT